MIPAIRNDSHTAAPATSPAAPSSAKIPAPTIAPTPMKAAWRTDRYFFSGGAAPGLPVSSISAMSSLLPPCVWVSPVGRYGLGLGHLSPLGEVDRDTEQEGDSG